MKQIETVAEFQVYFSEFQQQPIFSSINHEMIFYDRNCETETRSAMTVLIPLVAVTALVMTNATGCSARNIKAALFSIVSIRLYIMQRGGNKHDLQ